MKTLVALCVLVLAAGLGAAERKFETVEKAQQMAVSSGKGVFVICYADVPGDATNAKIQFGNAIKDDAAIFKLAECFELAVVDCFSIANKDDNQCVNPQLQAKYGWPCTVSVYAPSATRSCWHREMSHDDTSARREHTKDSIASALREASEAWLGARKFVDEIEAKFKADRAEKSNPTNYTSLGDAWARVFSATKARAAYDEALKLMKKLDKDTRRAEMTSMRAASAEFESEAWDAAIKACDNFVKTYKDSDQVYPAKLLAAKAMAKKGDKEAAKVALEKIIKDKKAEPYHKQAQDELDALKQK